MFHYALSVLLFAYCNEQYSCDLARYAVVVTVNMLTLGDIISLSSVLLLWHAICGLNCPNVIVCHKVFLFRSQSLQDVAFPF